MSKHDKTNHKKRNRWSEDSSDDLNSVAKNYNRAQAKKNWQAELEATLDEELNGLGERQESDSH